jgi:hypothetical protein
MGAIYEGTAKLKMRGIEPSNRPLLRGLGGWPAAIAEAEINMKYIFKGEL